MMHCARLFIKHSTFIIQLDYWFEMDAYLTTMYFVDPSIICNGGRSKDMFEDQGTGDRLVIQVPALPLLSSMILEADI